METRESIIQKLNLVLHEKLNCARPIEEIISVLGSFCPKIIVVDFEFFSEEHLEKVKILKSKAVSEKKYDLASDIRKQGVNVYGIY